MFPTKSIKTETVVTVDDVFLLLLWEFVVDKVLYKGAIAVHAVSGHIQGGPDTVQL